ncbi:MAG: rhodanese-like domain-containing protein [Acidobacteria bacterium]|nr:rhodanese-like domain-containing protein [Acidobacteriota bacterium]
MFAFLMGLKTVSPAQLEGELGDGRTVVVDVNAPQVWASGHVPGAINRDSGNLRESDLPADKAAALVFYCSNSMCRKAPNAARKAQLLGYQNVRVMAAGISGWMSAKLPVERGAV